MGSKQEWSQKYDVFFEAHEKLKTEGAELKTVEV